MSHEQTIELAAILLLGVGEENAAEILRYMDSTEVQKLSAAMSRMGHINRAQVQQAIQRFVTDIEQQTSFGLGTDTYVKNMLESAMGKDRAGGLYTRIRLGIETDGLEALARMEAMKVVDLLANEHPQIKALVFSYLDPEKSAEILNLLAEHECLDVMLRMATLDAVQPEVLQMLNEIIEQALARKTKHNNAASLGGSRLAANILNYFQDGREQSILAGIAEISEDKAQEICELMFIFEHLQFADDRSMQSLLRHINAQTLQCALKGADEAISEKFFANMSVRAAGLLKDDMDNMGPVRISDVELAQKEIVTVATRLRDDGQFRLLRGNEEML